MSADTSADVSTEATYSTHDPIFLYTLDRVSRTFQAFTCFYPAVFHLKKIDKFFFGLVVE